MEYEESILLFDISIILFPGHADSYFCKGNTLFELRRYEEAIASYEFCIKVNPQHYQASQRVGEIKHQLNNDILLNENIII
mmetsp:Transcript_16172/g.13315  ORF Transcript_16172/g.13315 Transcript_16172/m.13315 type:complete len:81 (+) Transcript_16172:586-828(+)